MPLAPQIYNPGSRGQNARYDVRDLFEVRPGVYTDGVYEYDENGLSLNRPDSHVRGLKPADEMDDDQWGNYLGPNRPRWNPDPPQQAAPPRAAEPQAPAAAAPEETRIPDAQNPRAIEYALRRLQQLRSLGYDFEMLDDPAATWRRASEGVTAAAGEAGYENPRDWLAGRPLPPRRGRPVLVEEPADYATIPARLGPRRRPPDVVQRTVRSRPRPKRNRVTRRRLRAE